MRLLLVLVLAVLLLLSGTGVAYVTGALAVTGFITTDNADFLRALPGRNFNRLSSVEKEERSEDVRKRVVGARSLQKIRYSQYQGIYNNSQMNSKLLQRYCRIDESSLQLLKVAMERLQLSARAYDRILKVARTIADLDMKTDIEAQHLAEAIQYRSLDRENWGK